MVSGDSMVKLEDLDYKPKPIEENFAEDTTNYPVTGKHHEHEVRAEEKTVTILMEFVSPALPSVEKKTGPLYDKCQEICSPLMVYWLNILIFIIVEILFRRLQQEEF